jgi:hypothetical protein
MTADPVFSLTPCVNGAKRVLERQLSDVFEAHFRGIKDDLELAFGSVSGETGSSGSRSSNVSDVEIRYYLPSGQGLSS